MRKRIISIILTFVITLSLLAGCTNSNTTAEPDTSGTTETEENSKEETAENEGSIISVDDLDPSWMEVQSAEESGTKLKVAFSTMNITNDNYMTSMADSMKEYVEGLGHEFVLSVASSSWGAPVSMQVNAIEDLISSNVDVLVFHAFDENALIPVIKKCNEAGIVCVNIDSKLADDKLYVTYVGADNTDKGRTAAEGLLKDYPDVKKYILLGGAEGNPSTLDRTEGFKNYMAENAPDSACVGDYFANADSDTAMSYVQNALVSDPDLDAVYAVTDSMITGIVQALKQSGKKAGEVKVVGTDGIAYVVSDIEEGWVTGDVLAQAEDTILTGCQIGISSKQGLLKKESIAKTINIVCPYVSKENLDEYADSFY